ncbi:hypothetical protein T265_10037 [Opisthorchis viverrini]|uniref:Large ribosomal subunit protein uL13 n=2 Tax=Opisthorchis viverrini TaxID=6198 RepID=A0A075A2U5_OPIVI|nr:hypothetical protein T265_10037 [Opisthorchis viverrini]KER21689.1 hypothetical protein T265_10037 [Opisthorchis viverrini]
MRILPLAGILPRAENIKSSATHFFHWCLSGERQALTDKDKTNLGNLGKRLDPVYQSMNPCIELNGQLFYRRRSQVARGFHYSRAPAMGFQKKAIIIDGKDHLLGRLAAIVAKTLLNGQNVVVVRCEQINISGSFYRNKLKYLDFLRKRMSTNPSRGPYHFRAPAKIFWRTVRGMLPHKLYRGKEALDRLKVFEGIPPPYDKKKRMVVPSALRVMRLKQRRKFCVLSRLSHEVGWKYKNVIEKMENRRKAKSAVWYKKKRLAVKPVEAARSRAREAIAPYEAILKQYGY